MSTQARHGLFAFTTAIILSLLACNLATPTPSTEIDATKVALQAQLTMQAIQNATLAAQVAQGVQPTQGEQSTQGGQPLPTYTPFPTYTLPAPTQIIPSPTPNIADQIESAKILVFEDTFLSFLGPWVKDALDAMGLNYKYDADAMGDFMGDLNSSTPWDLIIVSAENRDAIQGEFWDVIVPKVIQDKTALIVEMWYLSDTANGRIKSLTVPCGIEFQGVRKNVESIYILQPEDPVFTTPNSGFALIHFNPVWFDKGGDYIRLPRGSNAILLAGGLPNEKSSYGLMASCFDGRVILQTFSNHDYRRSDILMLWQNYITNTLRNHFEAVP